MTMGYYTRFTLSTRPNEAWDEVEKYVGENYTENDYLPAIISDDGETYKWYGHMDDVKELSTHFPDVVFVLYGEGEESGDLWYKYFKNGKVQECPGSVTFPPYDESRLR